MSKVFENELAIIPAEEIEEALKKTDRQYIQGNLQSEQMVSFIRTMNSEIGISDYKEYTHDEPHYHDEVMETNYIITGAVCLRNLETGEDFVVKAGGVFSVPPHIPHVLKIKAGTRIIFTKTPSVNDKHVLNFDDLGLEEWYRDETF